LTHYPELEAMLDEKDKEIESFCEVSKFATPHYPLTF